jgi:hypothetical protein
MDKIQGIKPTPALNYFWSIRFYSPKLPFTQ